MFLWKKSHILVDMVEEYFKKAEECMVYFQESMNNYLENGLSADFDGFIEKTHIAESSCDDIRLKIESAMYEKSLIPESRGDILGMLEIIDRIPNKAESILYMIQTQFLNTPEEIKGKISQLIKTNINAFTELMKAVRQLFIDGSGLQAFTDNIDKEESSSDHLEREIIRTIFSTESIAPDQKILLKELIIELGSISDKCENTADAITIIAVKRII